MAEPAGRLVDCNRGVAGRPRNHRPLLWTMSVKYLAVLGIARSLGWKVHNALRQRLSRGHQVHAAVRVPPRCAGCAYPRVRSPFTSIFLSQALELGNKDDKVDNKEQEQ
jgi:hypothetical protein